ncbi:MAG: glycosyltransferase family 4 protein [Ardenticatenaceae bacterium]|nr:glycosyltransferase family 4 protein [Ardenticatenaceae bacterium]MCB9442656.1 glycosyltransferase family 4 protein [Ardenticatenaceae bacterium]
MIRIGFVIEQALGHVTHGQNLQKNVALDPSIDAKWVLPAWEAGGLAGLIPNWTFRAGWQARQGIAGLQRQAPLDALFFHTQVTAVLATNWINQIPSIISLDATPMQYDELGEFYAHDPGPAWLENWKWKLNRNAFRTAKHIVTWSEWAKEGLVRDYEVPADKITVIPPGVNVQEWCRPQQRAGSPNAPVKILFVGGNLERKGGFVLLEAFRSLKTILANDESESKIELHLVTKDQVDEEPGLFVYNNMQPNSAPLRQLYHDCDIFCLPTYGDCLPMVLSEAGAAGLPTISTNVAAIPEITLDGKTGYIIPPGDASSLVQALKKLVVDAGFRQQQGKQATEYVQQKFDAQANATRLLKLLKETAEHHSSKR